LLGVGERRENKKKNKRKRVKNVMSERIKLFTKKELLKN